MQAFFLAISRDIFPINLKFRYAVRETNDFLKQKQELIYILLANSLTTKVRGVSCHFPLKNAVLEVLNWPSSWLNDVIYVNRIFQIPSNFS